MANVIKLKRGTSTPTTSNIVDGEVAVDTSAKKLYVNDGSTIKEIGGGLQNVVEDTTPQLGGNLDVQSSEITTSTSNGNIKLNPNGTGVVEIKGDGSSADGTLQLNCSQNSHGIKLKSPAHSAGASYTLTFPNTDGSADQVLKTDGSGGLDWVDQSSGGLSSDAQRNTVGGSNAGNSFTGTDATDNTLIGYDAGTAITTADQITAFGTYAAKAITTGGGSTAFGRLAGSGVSTGVDNVFIGQQAGHTQGNLSNSLFIARDNTGSSVASTWIYGNSSGACYQGNNSTTWSTTSDIRLKKNIVDSPKGLAEINQLRVTNFEYKTEEEIDMSEFPLADSPNQVCLNDETKEGVTQTGFIAQEVEKILPECVKTSDKGAKTVNTDAIMLALVNAVKELSAKVETLQSEINTLKGG